MERIAAVIIGAYNKWPIGALKAKEKQINQSRFPILHGPDSQSLETSSMAQSLPVVVVCQRPAEAQRASSGT
jgi:hypothetical protein